MKTECKVRITRNTVAACRPVKTGEVVHLPADEALALLEMRGCDLIDPPDRAGLVAAARATMARARLPAQWSPH